jgi:hypothetical protein
MAIEYSTYLESREWEMGNREWGEKLSSFVVYAVHGVSCKSRNFPPDAPNWRWEPEFKVPQNWGMRGGIPGFMQETPMNWRSQPRMINGFSRQVYSPREADVKT